MKLLLALVSLFVFTNTYASFDILGGVSLNIPRSTEANSDKKNDLSFNAGALYKFESNSDYSIRTGLIYQRKTGTVLTDSYELNFDLDYLTLPLSLLYKVDKKTDLIFGLHLSSLIEETYTLERGDKPFKNAEPFVTSFILGGQEQVYKSFYLEAYLEQSLTRVFKKADILSFNVNAIYKVF